MLIKPFRTRKLLTLTRLGVRVQLPPPPPVLVVSPKMYFLKRRWNPAFLWLLIISYVTSSRKILFKFVMLLRKYEDFSVSISYFHQFSSISRFFLRRQHFFTFNILYIDSYQLHKVILILDYFFLKYEWEEEGIKLIPPRKKYPQKAQPY